MSQPDETPVTPVTEFPLADTEHLDIALEALRRVVDDNGLDEIITTVTLGPFGDTSSETLIIRSRGRERQFNRGGNDGRLWAVFEETAT